MELNKLILRDLERLIKLKHFKNSQKTIKDKYHVSEFIADNFINIWKIFFQAMKVTTNLENVFNLSKEEIEIALAILEINNILNNDYYDVSIYFIDAKEKGE